MDKMISIIVPVYNSAPYLKGCVASVLKQTYKNFELLFITDGPTDGSDELCARYARKDRRIRFLPQKHRGVSAARNVGLEQAAGEYLFFLDSDDAIHPQLLEKLMRVEEKTKAVIIAEDFRMIQSGQFERKVFRLSASSGRFLKETYQHLESREALDYIIFDRPQGRLYAIGGKLIERTEAQKIRFDEALRSGEDTKYMYQLLAEGADVAALDEKSYYYRKHWRSRSAERTAEACKSMYACNKYIWLQEKRKGRELHAQKQTEKTVRRLCAWHAAARMKQNCPLIQYTCKLVKKERDCPAKKRMGWRAELEYWLAFYCYPAYQPCYKMLDFFDSIGARLWKR